MLCKTENSSHNSSQQFKQYMNHMAFPHHLLLVLLLLRCTAESAELWGQYCNDNSNITSTKLSKNIDSLLAELVFGTMMHGFTSTSYGRSEDKVYGLAQCRGDVSRSDCSICIREAAQQIRRLCPNQAGARVWYDYCFLRYDTQKFSGQVDASVGIFVYDVQNVTDPDSFNKKLKKLTDKIGSEAVQYRRRGLGRGKGKLSPSITLYALAQCTRDLSPFSCAQCLTTAFGNFPTLCNDKRGCRVLYSSCTAQYELYPFFFPVVANETLAHVPIKNYASVHKH